MSNQPRRYLGDAVYATFDGYHIWIWTSNGIRESERIALEPGVLNELNRFSKELHAQQIRDQTSEHPDGEPDDVHPESSV